MQSHFRLWPMNIIENNISSLRVTHIKILYITFFIISLFFILFPIGTYYYLSIHGFTNNFDPTLSAVPMSFVHLAFVIIDYPVAYYIFYLFLSKAKSLRSERGASPVAKSTDKIFQAFIIRAIMIYGVGGFGFGTCLIATISGFVNEHPLLWLNLLSPAIAVIFLLATFPSDSRLQQLIDDKY